LVGTLFLIAQVQICGLAELHAICMNRHDGERMSDDSRVDRWTADPWGSGCGDRSPKIGLK